MTMAYTQYIIYSTGPAIVSIMFIVLYRLYFHPLAKVPGPKRVAISRIYEWYYDCIQFGTFCWKIEEWHAQYGPIIRISPNEVHIDDPDWYDVLYNSSTKLDKDGWYYGMTGSNDSTFATVGYDVHRMKRSKQNSFFSRQNVDKSSHILLRFLHNILSQFERYRNTGKPLMIRNALQSYATDVACEFLFPSGTEFTKESDFAKSFHNGWETFTRFFSWIRHFPIISKLLFALPDSLVPYMNQETQAAIGFTKLVEVQARESLRQSNEKEPYTKKTIIRELYESNMPSEYRTEPVLREEAMSLVGAGTSTVSRMLECGMFYILQNPTIAKKLTEEVRSIRTDEQELLTHRDLEDLPYLTAVVLECQRMSPANRSRFPRINRTQDMFYKDYRLPKGTVISMGSWDVMLNDSVWQNAWTFDPSRWLDPQNKKKMQKYMVPFSRGSRSCVGQNLAVAEIYTVLGNFFRTFHAELYSTDIREIEIVADCFVPYTYKGSTGVQVVLT